MADPDRRRSRKDRRDRRRVSRIARPLLVRYQAPSTPALWFTAPTLDFSGMGARLMAEHPFQAGDAVTLQFMLPPLQKFVALEARVVRATPSKLGTVAIGVVFDQVETDARRAIAEAASMFLLRRARAGRP